jgi:hypothetical protein
MLFTPNSDGINDCFTIQGAQGSPFFELSIYNRFGEKVFLQTILPAAGMVTLEDYHNLPDLCIFIENVRSMWSLQKKAP